MPTSVQPRLPAPGRSPRGDDEAREIAALGQVIRRLRLEAGIAQEAFARSAGIDRSYYSKVERGQGNPSFPVIRKIARALEVSASALVARAEDLLADKPTSSSR